MTLLSHLLSGLHFVHTSSVAPQPLVSFLPLTALSSKYPQGEAHWLFSTLHHLPNAMHLTSTVGHHRDRITTPLAQLPSLLFPLSYPFYFCVILLTAFPGQGILSAWVESSPFYCAFNLQVSLFFLSLLSSPATFKLRTCFGG